MKKRYTKPVVKKVELRPEEAVLANCKTIRTCIGLLKRPFNCDPGPSKKIGS